MAGEITQEAIVLALGGAGIGATGAIITQIVGGIFTAKREKRKTISDRELWEHEAEAKRRDRSLDQKIEIFTEILALSADLSNDVYFQIAISDELRATFWQQTSSLRSMAQRVSILAPELFGHAEQIVSKCDALVAARRLEENGADPTPPYSAALKSIADAREAFRAYIDHKPIPAVQKP